MKKTICIALAALMLCAMPCHINASAEPETGLPLPEMSASSAAPLPADSQQPAAEPEQEPAETEEPAPETTEPDPADDDESEKYEPEYVPVENIEIEDFETEMFVKGTQTLFASVFPNNATEQNVTFSSSNTAVATVTTGGKITAVGKGSCRIYASCDNFTVYYPLTVKVETESIDVVSKFIVIKPGEQFDLEAAAKPADASQKLEFQSGDDSIVSVSKDGILTAVSIGSTSVIVSNEDSSVLVNVIVSAESTESGSRKTSGSGKPAGGAKTDSLVQKISESDEKEVIVKDLKLISSSVLKSLYGTEKSLTVDLDAYTLSIRGQDIFNACNEVSTQLELSDTDNGMYVTLSDEKKLPGTISISLKNAPQKYKYFYQVNKDGSEYRMLNSLSGNTFKVSSVGKYLLSNKNMNRTPINFLWILGGAGVILLLSVIYIFTKKKYWFW